MKLDLNAIALLPPALAAVLTLALPAVAQQQPAPAQQSAPAEQPAPAAPDNNAPLNVEQLFATTCGWCHSDGGREAGKGPQLMNTTRDDDFIRNRIKNGKPGSMPAFGSTFSDAQIDQIIKYIRSLKAS